MTVSIVVSGLEQIDKGVGEHLHAEGVGMVDGVHHEAGVGDALPPETAIAHGGVCQGNVLLHGELAEGDDIAARVVVDVFFGRQSHPVRADVVGREDDPFGADGGEIAEEFAVAVIDDLFVQACIVDEFGDDKIRLNGENCFVIVMNLACGLGKITGRIVAAPSLCDKFYLGLREQLLETFNELVLPTVVLPVWNECADGHAVAPCENLHLFTFLELGVSLWDKLFSGMRGGAQFLRKFCFENREEIFIRQFWNAAVDPDVGEANITIKQFRLRRIRLMRHACANGECAIFR